MTEESTNRLKKKLLDNNKYNITYTFNTDGCKSAFPSHTTMWPVYIDIPEFDSKRRSSDMLMVALWVDKTDPDMQVFMKSFIDDANKLQTEGVEWTHPSGEKIISKFFPGPLIVDSKCRCAVLEMKQYNGYYGCTFCKHPTERTEDGRRFTIINPVPALRKDKEVLEIMSKFAENAKIGDDLEGIKEASAFMNLKNFNMVDNVVPEYMHSTLLGVITQHTEGLLNDTDKPYYIGKKDQIAEIDERLNSIKNPKCITRSARKISERGERKANEWRSWLLWYSLPCMKRI